MKNLVILTSLFLLLACSKNENNLTLSCYGTLLTSENGKLPINTSVTKLYKFSNLKFDDYVCGIYSNITACDAVKDEDGIRVRKRIIYDTKTYLFTEIIRTLNTANNDKADKTVIRQTEFIGNCQKPIIN